MTALSTLSANKKRPHPEMGDRFIPKRQETFAGEGAQRFFEKDEPEDPSPFNKILKESLFGIHAGDRVLKFKSNPSQITEPPINARAIVTVKRSMKPLPADRAFLRAAPKMTNDYYADLVCFSKENVLAAALHDDICFEAFITKPNKFYHIHDLRFDQPIRTMSYVCQNEY